MCQSLFVYDEDGRCLLEAPNQAELKAFLPEDAPVVGDLRFPLFMGLKPTNLCLCPIDLEATGEANHYLVERDANGLGKVTWRQKP